MSETTNDRDRTDHVGKADQAGKTPDAKTPDAKTPEAKTPDSKTPENKQGELNERLDEALEETFPSSDPVSVKITK